MTFFSKHSATEGHRSILAYSVLHCAKDMGKLHCLSKIHREQENLAIANPRGRCAKNPEMVALHAMNHLTAMEELGSPRQPSYCQSGKLGVAYDWIFFQQRAIGHVKHTNRQQAQYKQEYEEVLRKICGYRSFVGRDRKGRIIPASLKDPDLVLPLREMRTAVTTPRRTSKWVEDTEEAPRSILRRPLVSTSLSEDDESDSLYYG